MNIETLKECLPILETLNKWVSLAANVVVVFSIVFLVLELRRSNRNMKLSNRIAIGNAEIAISALAAEVNNTIFESQETAELLAKLAANQTILTPVEKLQATYVGYRHINRWNASKHAFDSGLISERTFEIQLQDVGVTLNRLPGLAPILLEILRSYPITQTDPSAIEKCILTDPYAIGKRILKEAEPLGYQQLPLSNQEVSGYSGCNTPP